MSAALTDEDLYALFPTPFVLPPSEFASCSPPALSSASEDDTSSESEEEFYTRTLSPLFSSPFVLPPPPRFPPSRFSAIIRQNDEGDPVVPLEKLSASPPRLSYSPLKRTSSIRRRLSLPTDVDEDHDDVLDYYTDIPTIIEEKEEDEPEFVFDFDMLPPSPPSPPPSAPLSLPPQTSSPAPSSSKTHTPPLQLSLDILEYINSPDSSPPPSPKILRSRWSSSTLSEEIAMPKSPVGKIWASIGSPRKRSFSIKDKQRSAASPKSPSEKEKKRRLETVPVFPYAYPPPPPSPSHNRRSSPQPKRATVSRRPSSSSSSTSSSRGSISSWDSTSSSGLRRKPIPVEMFLRA